MNDFLKTARGFLAAPKPGMIGLTQISGDVGKAIELGQWMNGEGFLMWEHSFVFLPNNQILEAEPGGAVIRPLHYSMVYWCTGLYELLPMTPAPSDTACWMAVANQFKGIPYSFADYAALAAHRLHVPAPGLRDYIKDSGHEICSQLVDDLYNRLGAHIFTDNRWPGYVTPASLYKRDLELK